MHITYIHPKPSPSAHPMPFNPLLLTLGFVPCVSASNKMTFYNILLELYRLYVAGYIPTDKFYWQTMYLYYVMKYNLH